MDEIEEKIARYFRNANRFMWGLIGENQKDTYGILSRFEFKDHGSVFKGSYETVSRKMVEQYGMENILKGFVTKEINNCGSKEYIDLLRECWKACVQPNMAMLRAKRFETFVNGKNYPKYDGIFLKYNKQFDFIEGWGELAGIWFEEIEPWLNDIDSKSLKVKVT
jgi:hypothetical protein